MSKYDAFTLRADAGLLRYLKTDVYVCVHEETTKQKQKIKAQAIWDTGATITCISHKIAKDLKLVAIGFGRMNTANGLIQVPRYKVNLILPNQISILNLTVSGFCGCSDVDMLIGMDVICRGDFSITNANGTTLMSYRMPPSDIHIDYEKNF